MAPQRREATAGKFNFVDGHARRTLIHRGGEDRVDTPLMPF
jgi:hypothetical protein